MILDSYTRANGGFGKSKSSQKLHSHLNFSVDTIFQEAYKTFRVNGEGVERAALRRSGRNFKKSVDSEAERS